MEKTLRVLGGEEEHSGHLHSHSHSEPSIQASGVTSSLSSQNGLRARGIEKLEPPSSVTESVKAVNGPSKLSAYLNLFGDFVHNM